MTRYGPKTISLEQVQKNYDSIPESTYFNQKTKPLVDNIKPISSEMVEILMLLGLNGLHFLDRVLRSQAVRGFSSSDIFETYCLCDGFGLLSAKELSEINDGWDWSHVRDSSVEALLNAENFAKQKIIDIYNNYSE